MGTAFCHPLRPQESTPEQISGLQFYVHRDHSFSLDLPLDFHFKSLSHGGTAGRNTEHTTIQSFLPQYSDSALSVPGSIDPDRRSTSHNISRPAFVPLEEKRLSGAVSGAAAVCRPTYSERNGTSCHKMVFHMAFIQLDRSSLEKIQNVPCRD